MLITYIFFDSSVLVMVILLRDEWPVFQAFGGSELLSVQHLQMLGGTIMIMSTFNSFDTVMHNLTRDEAGNDSKLIYSMANSIEAPTLVLWGDSDQVR